MTRSAASAVALLFAAGLAATLSSRARACECTAPLELDLMVARSSTVFTGKVIAIQPSANGQYVLLTLAPTLRWKGGLTNPMVVANPGNDGICMLHVAIGTEYLFFTEPVGAAGPAPETGVYVMSCDGSAPSQGNPFLPGLGAPLNPTPTLASSWGALKLIYR